MPPAGPAADAGRAAPIRRCRPRPSLGTSSCASGRSDACVPCGRTARPRRSRTSAIGDMACASGGCAEAVLGSATAEAVDVARGDDTAASAGSTLDWSWFAAMGVISANPTPAAAGGAPEGVGTRCVGRGELSGSGDCSPAELLPLTDFPAEARCSSNCLRRTCSRIVTRPLPNRSLPRELERLSERGVKPSSSPSISSLLIDDMVLAVGKRA